MSETQPEHVAEGHGGDHDEIHMPPNSYWPLVASFGTAGTLLGIIYINSNIVVLLVGLLILLVGVGGWVRDARSEYNELH
ncbi:MAG: hypothetical protein NVSMB17_07060 [Candidatus Dormibacteria bacterium]